jgi:hypothetical protein
MDHAARALLLTALCLASTPLAWTTEHRPDQPAKPPANLYDPAADIDFTAIDPSRDPGVDPIFSTDPRLARAETYAYRETRPGDHQLPKGTGVVRFDVKGRESLAQVLATMRSSLSGCTGIAIYLANGTSLNDADLATVQRLNQPTAAGGLDLIGIDTLCIYNLKTLAGGVQTTEATINGAFMWSNGWERSGYKHLVLDDLEEVGDGTFCENPFVSVSLRAARSIGVMAFGAARSSHPPLRELYLPSATVIKSHAFRRNRNLITVDLPRVTFIDSYGFDDCFGLQYVNAPELKTIGRNVFNDNGSLVSMNLPKLETTSVATWGWPGKMRVLRLPSLVKTNDLNALETVRFLYVPMLRSADGSMFAKELRALYAPKLEQVGKGAFSQCSHLRRIDLPSGANVSPEAFTGLTDVEVLIRGKRFPIPTR